MSRSYRNVYKTTVCNVGSKFMHEWKTQAKRLRRTRCKQILNNLDLSDENIDETF